MEARNIQKHLLEVSQHDFCANLSPATVQAAALASAKAPCFFHAAQ